MNSISQGQQAGQYIDDYLQQVPRRLPFLALTSSPALGSINEAFRQRTPITPNELAFHKTLLQYATLKKSYADSLLKHSNTPDEIRARYILQEQLNDTNRQLVEYAQAISADVGNSQVTDKRLQQSIVEQQHRLQEYIHSLGNTRNQIDYITAASTNAAGQAETAELILVSQRHQYMAWVFVTLAVVGLTLHYILYSEATGSLFLVVLLLSLYIGAKWMR
jgi:hypothetical protein